MRGQRAEYGVPYHRSLHGLVRLSSLHGAFSQRFKADTPAIYDMSLAQETVSHYQTYHMRPPFYFTASFLEQGAQYQQLPSEDAASGLDRLF